MAVAPDFHTDFLTVGAKRLALSPTSPSGREGIILRSGIFYHAAGRLSRRNINVTVNWGLSVCYCKPVGEAFRLPHNQTRGIVSFAETEKAV